MKSRIAGPSIALWLTLLSPALLPAAPVRLTAWDWQAKASSDSYSLVREAAASLKNIDPDIVLLQDAEGLQTCQELVLALQPQAYQVVVCSSFRDANGKPASRQVAILSKATAPLAWPEPWQINDEAAGAPGGFAFAALPVGNANIGVFSTEFNDGDTGSAGQAGDDSALQLVKAIDSLKNFRGQPLQAIIVAGNFTTAPKILPLIHEKTFLHLGQIGFESAFTGPNALINDRSRAASLNFAFTRGGSLAAAPVTTRTVLFVHDAVTFEMNFDVGSRLAAAPEPVAKARAPVPGRAGLLWLAAILPVIFGVYFLLRKPRQPLPVALRTPDAVREGVVANLTLWLKQRFMQRLLADRAQLIATQETAALKALAVNERLTKIEIHIQQRNREYEQRIDELMQALDNAREENRELIRDKIALLRAEMEKAEFAGEHDEDYKQY